MRKTLSDRGILALKPRATRYAFADPELRGLLVRVQPSGAKSFCTVAVEPTDGRQVWTTLGGSDGMTIAEARAKARDVLARVRAGLPAFETPPLKPDTFAAVAETYLKRHVEASGLRTRYEIERVVRKYVLPAWGERAFVDLRRSDLASLLDRIEDEHGRHTADCVLARVRAVAHWYALRHDSYISPFTRGMRRTDPKSRKRARILDDGEIRALWHVTEGEGRYNGIIRLLLLTGQRRERVGSMRWADIALDGTWTLPDIERAKGTGGTLVLPPIALKIVQAQPRLTSNPYVFGIRGGKPFCGWSLPKRGLDAALPAMAPWTVHDLRRTARSLLSRANVRPDVAERVLGHAQGGVQAIYDRHSYGPEKADALRKLAALIETIIDPRDNVVPLTAKAK